MTTQISPLLDEAQRSASYDESLTPETWLHARNVGYSINGKQLLSNVDAQFAPKTITALMGPSGAGKTTLLNTLSARSAGDRTGDILVNGRAISRRRIRLLLSYMPQDDILYMELTVRQMLIYSALLRCPREWTHDAKLERVETIMTTLGMSHVADNVLYNVSGGQRKRASAAVEFLSTRPLLFMDEPTSGLDSATAAALALKLRDAAKHERRTVIATIHQPSWNLLCDNFDRVLLLSVDGDRGGCVAFDGPPKELPGHFAAGGAPSPTGENPADHMMYVMSGEGGAKWADFWAGCDMRKFVAKDIEQNVTTLAADSKRHVIPGGAHDDLDDDDLDDDEESACPALLTPLPTGGLRKVSGGHEYPISYMEQYRILFLRAVHIWVTDPQQGPLIFKMLFYLNTCLILMIHGMTPNISKATTVYYYIVSEYTMSITPLVIIMPEEKGVILREYRNGVFGANVYWFARVSLALCHAICVATISTVYVYPLISMPLVPFPSKFARWWLSQFLYLSCVMMLGLAVGVISPSALAGIKSVVAIELPWLVTGGALPPLSMVRPAVFPLHYPNLFTWAGKLALTIGFTSHGDKAFDTLTNQLLFHPGNADSCFLALGVAFGVIFLMGLAFTTMALNRGDKTAGTRAPPKPASQAPQQAQPVINQPTVQPPFLATSTTTSSTSETNPLLEPSAAGYGATKEDIEAGIEPPEIRIEVEHVSYRHQSKPEKIAVNDVSLVFEPGSITILMGPSGAGKTTLLNLLSGRLPELTYVDPADGKTERPCLEGDVFIDGRKANFKRFKKIGTVTPQDEHLTEVLTVRQTLMFTAELRLPAEFSRGQRIAKVNDIIAKLGLAAKADNVVGGGLKVGISGGQKKRLSIGIDLLANLPVMLVDEPTTGLDASAALNVVETLLNLAKDLGRTIIATIHQPPWTMVCQFDQLALLASGCLVFDGPPAGLADFLVKGGATIPSNENPADFAMETLINEGTDKWLNARDRYTKSSSSSSLSLSKQQQLKLEAKKERDLVLRTTGGQGGGDDDLDDDSDKPAYARSEFMQWWIMFRRVGYVFMIDEDQFPEVLFPALFVCFFLGAAFHNFPTNIYIGGGLLCGMIAHGMIILNGIILNMPLERDLILREFRNGAYSVKAYWFARAILTLLICIFLGLPMTLIWYSMFGLTNKIANWFHVYVGSTLCASVIATFGCIIGLVMKTPLASAQVAEPLGAVMAVFSGQIITRRFIRDYAKPFYWGFPVSWAFEIIVTAALEDKGEKGQDVLSYFNFHPSNRRNNYLILTAMLIFWLWAGYQIAIMKIGGQLD